MVWNRDLRVLRVSTCWRARTESKFIFLSASCFLLIVISECPIHSQCPPMFTVAIEVWSQFSLAQWHSLDFAYVGVMTSCLWKLRFLKTKEKSHLVLGLGHERIAIAEKWTKNQTCWHWVDWILSPGTWNEMTRTRYASVEHTWYAWERTYLIWKVRKGIPECLLNKSTANFEIRNAFNFLHACL